MLTRVGRPINLRCLSEVCFCVVQLALLLSDLAQFIERGGDPRVGTSVDVALNTERFFQQGRSFIELVLGYEGACKDCDLRRGFGVIVAVKRARDVQRLPVEAFSVRVMPLLELNGAKIDEIVGNVGMTLAVELPVHCKNTLVQGFRHGIVSDVKMAVGQDSESLREFI